MSDMGSEGLLTVDEAAKRLGVAAITVRWLMRTKQISYVIVARKARFRPQDIEKYIRENLVEAV